jgi:hypothetical protein
MMLVDDTTQHFKMKEQEESHCYIYRETAVLLVRNIVASSMNKKMTHH